ncbi:hypothetical protein Pelo_2866 [Pelomyxa schiedti]|nr:hypothetical protein Pelo_2866 [Pelomyxa schiedti]
MSNGGVAVATQGGHQAAQLEKHIATIDDILTACLLHVSSACASCGVRTPAPLQDAIGSALANVDTAVPPGSPPACNTTPITRAKMVLQRARQFADAMQELPQASPSFGAAAARAKPQRRLDEVAALEQEAARLDATIAETKAKCLELHRTLADTHARLGEQSGAGGSAPPGGLVASGGPGLAVGLHARSECSPSPTRNLEGGVRTSTPPNSLPPVTKARSLSSPSLPKEGLIKEGVVEEQPATETVEPTPISQQQDIARDPTPDAVDVDTVATDTQQEHTLALIHTAAMLLEEIMEDGRKIKILDVMQHIDDDLQQKSHKTPAFMKIFDS